MKAPIVLLWLILSQLVLEAQRPFPSRSEQTTQYHAGPDIIFDNYNERDGLSNNSVSALLQDDFGFLWLGTSNGLNRYDGKKFNVFKKNRRDKKSLMSNIISELGKDKTGKIYGLTPDGVFTYDYKADTFSNHYLDLSKKKIYPNDFCVVSTDLVAVGTSNSGLLIMDLKTKKTTTYAFNADDKYTLSTDRISRILLDPSGKGIWITTYQGLNYFDLKTRKTTNYRNTPNNEIFNNQNTEAIHLSSEGKIWVLNNETKILLCFDPQTKIVKHRIDLSKMLKIPYAGSIFETKNNELWYSSISYEIVRIKYKDSLSYQVIKNDPQNPASIPGNYIYCYWEDKDHTLWLGTVAGISRVNSDRNFYRVIPIFQQFPELEENNWQITCIAQNPKDQSWWWASRDGVVYWYNPYTGASQSVDIKEKTNYRNQSFFITDLEFIDDKIIICMSRGYPVEWNTKTNQFHIVYGDAFRLASYMPTSFAQETDSTWIISNNALPLLRWNKNDDSYTEINFQKRDVQAHGLFSANWMQSYPGKGVWIAAEKSLGFLEPGSQYLKRYALEEIMPDGSKIPINTGYYNSLAVDANGDAWFSLIGNGLYKMERQSGLCKAWDSSDGLTSEVLNSSTPSADGRIWCSSFNKFSVYDPESSRFFNFKLELSNHNSFYYNYTLPLKNGHVLTTLKGYLVEFYPEKVKKRYPGNPPMISAIEVPSGRQLIWNQEELILNPTDNFLTIHFASLSHTNIYDYFFQYRIVEINQSWIKAEKDDKASYTNLPPGHYQFELQAISRDGQWASEIKTLRFHIKAPFYKTWWFYLIMAAFIISVAGYVLNSRIKNIRNIDKLKSMAQLLEKEKTAVMYENLKQHLNPHFLFNSLTSLGSLIRINPKEAGDFLDKMSKVYRYILKNKDNETVPLSEELRFVELYIQLQQTRFGEGLKIEIDIPEESLHRKIAPVTLQNLVENAIKHNIADVDDPLFIRLYIADDYLIVENKLNRKSYVETSNKQGLNSMVSLYKFLSDRPLIVSESQDIWLVKIPLI
ncbi:MAG TPA: histidine kinase [Saprospiraceae bacterium]|nr:histidine kinase [Saprospiraceae bacterium]